MCSEGNSPNWERRGQLLDLLAYDHWLAQVQDDVRRETKVVRVGGLRAFLSWPKHGQRNISIWSQQFKPWTERCGAPEAYRGGFPTGWLCHGGKTCIICGMPMDEPALIRNAGFKSYKYLDGSCSACSALYETE